MRPCDYKKRYDPEMDMFVRSHVYGEGVFDEMKAVVNYSVKLSKTYRVC